MRRDLAAEDREHGRLAARRIEIEHIVAADCRRIVLRIVVERPHARIAPHHVRRRDRHAEPAVHGGAQIGDLLRRRHDRTAVVDAFDVGRADQRVIRFIGDCKDHPPVAVLEQVGLVAGEKSPSHDVAALDRPDRAPSGHPDPAEKTRRGRPGGVDQHPCPYRFAHAIAIQLGLPMPLSPGD